ncbi:sporulation protein YunB [Bacillaceae bacterium]
MAGFRTGRRGLSAKHALVVSFFLFLAMSVGMLYYVEVRIQPVLEEYALTKVKQIASQGINDALSKKIVEGSDFRELVVFDKDKDGKIRSILFNYNEYARVVSQAMARVQNYFNEVERLTVSVPLGQAMDSSILATFGPDVPVTFVPVGSVFADIKRKSEAIGINMVVTTVYVEITAEVKMVIPFATEPAKVRTEFPLTHILIVGDIPQFYYDGNGNPIGNYDPNNAPPPGIAPLIPIQPPAGG